MNNTANQTKLTEYRSRILFFSLYLADLYFIYSATYGCLPYCAAGMGTLIVMMLLSSPLIRLALGAYSVNGARPADREYIQRCFESIQENFRANGKPDRNVSLYICPGGGGVHAVGSSLVISEAMLDRSRRSYLEAAMAHSLAHIENLDSLFKTLLIINSAAGICFLAVTMLGMMIGMVMIAAIIAAVIGSGSAGMIAGACTAKGLKAVFKGVIKLYTAVMKLIYSLFLRASENAADDLAVRMGYGQQLLGYLRACEGDGTAAQMTPLESLLDSHPPTYRRIARLENRISSGGMNSQTGQNYTSLF